MRDSEIFLVLEHECSFQVVMAGIIAIYGVVVAVLIAGQLAPAGVGSDYTLYK